MLFDSRSVVLAYYPRDSPCAGAQYPQQFTSRPVGLDLPAFEDPMHRA